MVPGTPRGPEFQYQHYIPRFILRKFLEVQGPPKSSKQRSKENWKARKKGVETELLSVYDLSTKTLQSRSIAKSFGEVNLYTDLAGGIKSQHVEEKLSRLENEAAHIITTVQDSCGKGTFILTRRSLEVLRKFVFIMHFRKPKIQDMYFNVKAQDPLADWINQYMEKHKLKTPADMWLHALAYLLDTPHAEIVAEGERIQAQYGEERLMQMMKTKVDPNLRNWFAMDYQSLANSHYIGVWEAAPGNEFVVGNNSFGLWEGLICNEPGAHRIFVISPRLVLVLRCNVLRLPIEDVGSMVSSTLAGVDTPSPDTKYHGAKRFGSEEELQAYRATPAAQQDIFTYRITKLTEEQTMEVNEIVLVNVPQDGSLIFSSKEIICKTIRAHITSPVLSPHASDPYERYSALLFSLDPSLKPSGNATGSEPESDSDFRLRVVLEVLRLRLVRFRSEWDTCYWLYRAMTADPKPTHPLAVETHLRLEQVKGLIGNNFKEIVVRRNPKARLSDSLSAVDSDCVLGRTSTMLLQLMGYGRKKSRTNEAFVKESVMVGLIEWMVKERPNFIQGYIGSDVYRRLVAT